MNTSSITNNVSIGATSPSRSNAPVSNAGNSAGDSLRSMILALYKIMEADKKNALKGVGNGEDKSKLMEAQMKMGDADAGMGMLNAMVKSENEVKKSIASR
ncbi:hypothetical protein [Herbaspirillum sp. YR522]|uniref:hypothetical protein n=1 Tax=Herbaspirillum sp. YR522 TaxID=1144342 RepID=UPI00026FCD66|nr:hypothetical protein [Herbaspirillum sp. YR522]EJN02583.1 hypothetical protein PMI40_03121 [Herbaspirillum sp. YR522]